MAEENKTADTSKDWADSIDIKDNDTSGATTPDSKILNQDEIDSLLGYGADNEQESSQQTTGVRAILNSSMVSYERLPMLEIVFDRLIRLMATSRRGFTRQH